MASAYIGLADIVEPQEFQEYTVEQSIHYNKLLQSGIAVLSPSLQANALGGGRVIDIPYWDSLDTITDSEIPTTDTTEIETEKIGTSQETAIKNFRVKAIGYAPIVEILAGSDPAAAIAQNIAQYDARDKQNVALSMLKGIFNSASGVLRNTHVHDISTETGTSVTASNLISDAAIQDARFLLGDHFMKLGGIIMSSAVYKTLQTLDLIDFVPASEQFASPIPMYNNMRVIIDDAMTTTAITTPGGGYSYKYDTYLFAKGSFLFAPAPFPSGSPMYQVYSEPLKGNGSGLTSLIYRQSYILHPKGLKFVGTPSGLYPTNTEYATPANWAQVAQSKNIHIVKLTTNG